MNLLFITLQNNKKRYIAYNNFRHKIFLANSPKDAPVVLYMLPWLLSVNRSGIPGYVRELKESFRVFNIENNAEIIKRENNFKKMFGMREEKSLIRRSLQAPLIQGIYTIGSVGTVSQTSRSDCDIWICVKKDDFKGNNLQHLNEKLNLIKGWLDEVLKIPVYFFLSNVEDIRQCNFGNLDYEGSGSAQKNVLKEEFYRTTILIEGKIPFWWVCFDPDKPLDYDESYMENKKSDLGDHNFVDLGDLQQINQNEYFGASLWQFNKSLTHPLKSIIKMLQLKMFLADQEEELLCHKFRRMILAGKDTAAFPDPSIFAMNAVLNYYSGRIKEEHFDFIKKFFYLRFDMKMLSKTQTMKEEMAGEIFKKYKIDRKDIYRLNEFDSWKLQEKIDFGELLFEFLSYIYKDIVRIQKVRSREIAPQDLTIIGRKLSSSLEAREYKVPLMHVPAENIKLPALTFSYEDDIWQVKSSDDREWPLITDENIIFCISHIVWNGIYDAGQIRMQPNQTAVTLQEIINLGRKIRDVFGYYDISGLYFGNFLQKETISKMLFVVSFEKQSGNLDIEDICVIYKNNWEELFVRRFNSTEKMKAFLRTVSKNSPRLETHYYIRRNNIYYEKIIERTKNILTRMLIES